MIEIYFLKEVLFEKEIGKGRDGNIEMEEGKDIEKGKMIKKTKCMRQNWSRAGPTCMFNVPS